MKLTNTKPPAFLLIAMIIAVVLDFTLPIVSLIPSPWRLLGLLPLVFGIIINLQAARAFQTAQTAVDPSKTPSALVTSGPYRLTRNPMYLGFLLILFGVAVVLGALSAFLPVLGLTLLMDTTFIPMEERKLAAAFGPDWEAYKSCTERWL